MPKCFISCQIWRFISTIGTCLFPSLFPSLSLYPRPFHIEGPLLYKESIVSYRYPFLTDDPVAFTDVGRYKFFPGYLSFFLFHVLKNASFFLIKSCATQAYDCRWCTYAVKSNINAFISVDWFPLSVSADTHVCSEWKTKVVSWNFFTCILRIIWLRGIIFHVEIGARNCFK